MALPSRNDDRRVKTTRERLHGALFSLIHEKRYDAIAVKEILHRADVGRSTFYSHFDDKDELLEGGMLAMLREAQAKGRERHFPWSLPLFAHIDAWRRAARVGVADHATLHAHLERLLVQIAGEELAGRRARGASPAPDEPADDLRARHVAGTFLLVLGWGVEDGRRLLPEESDRLFRRLIAQ